jgi:lipoprotein-releasing system permease protein
MSASTPLPPAASRRGRGLPFPLYVAIRYTLSPRRNAFITLLSTISFLGVAVGVAALLIALALMTGFQEDVQARILGANAHLTIFGGWGGRPIADPRGVLARLQSVREVVAAAPVILEKGLLTSALNPSGDAVVIKGIDPAREARVTDLATDLREGELDALAPARGEEGVVLGNKLAYHLGVGIGDTVELLVPQVDVTPFHLRPKSRPFRVVGLVESGFYDYDSTRCYLGLDAAQRLFGLGEEVTAVEVRIANLGRLDQAQDAVEAALGEGFEVSNLLEMNRTFFSALRLEKLLLFLAVGLIVLVAALNIVSTLVLTVKDKTRDLGTLRALGATRTQVMHLFLAQGLLIGVIGTAAGCAAGVALCWWLDAYQVIALPAEVYYLSFVPFKVRLADFSAVASLAVVVSLLAALAPAWKASRLLPAEALRYE